MLLTLGSNVSQAAAAEEPQNAAAQAVSKAYSDFLAGDIAGVLAALSPKITWTIGTFVGQPYKHEYRGIQEVQEFFDTLNKTETPVKFDVIKIVASGNDAVALINYSAKVNATGKTYTTGFVHAWTADDSGALLSFTEYLSDSPAVAAAHVR